MKSHHYTSMYRNARTGRIRRHLTYDIFYEDEDIRVRIPAKGKFKEAMFWDYDEIWAVGGTGWKSHHRARHQWEHRVKLREKREKAARRRAVRRGEFPWQET